MGTQSPKRRLADHPSELNIFSVNQKLSGKTNSGDQRRQIKTTINKTKQRDVEKIYIYIHF